MIRIVRAPIPLADLEKMAQESFAELVKAVVDVRRGLMAIGGSRSRGVENPETRKQILDIVNRLVRG